MKTTDHKGHKLKTSKGYREEITREIWGNCDRDFCPYEKLKLRCGFVLFVHSLSNRSYGFCGWPNRVSPKILEPRILVKGNDNDE